MKEEMKEGKSMDYEGKEGRKEGEKNEGRMERKKGEKDEGRKKRER